MDDPIFDPWGAEPVTPEPAAPPEVPIGSPARSDEIPPTASDDAIAPVAEDAQGERAEPARPVAAPPANAPRWRSPAGPGPTPPPSPHAGPDLRRASVSADRPRLAGTPGFLRSMAVPRLEEIVRRLQMARHQAAVEDFLEAEPPTLRFTLRPWRGPWTEELAPPSGRLVLSLEDEDSVSVRAWLDPESEEPEHEAKVPPMRVSAAWLERLVLDFVERLLSRA